MKTIHLPFDIFKDEETFHAAFAKVMGFPDFYGSNWDAWIDCMSYIDDSEAGMSQVQVALGAQIEFVVSGYKFSRELDESDVFHNFCICSGFVNTRFKNSKSETRIIISN
ncbi:MAG: barstar family protein [Pseudomonadota bacterium]